jgi:YspA, cpYpsA-related SLOG family
MADPYRVLVTGSRGWQDKDAIWSALDAVLAQSLRPLLVVHGACTQGADQFAAEWVWANRKRPWPGVSQERHPAKWVHRQSGLDRNAEMVGAGADLCLAFIAPCRKRNCRTAGPHGSHGTGHCADLAEKAGIPVKRFTE